MSCTLSLHAASFVTASPGTSVRPWIPKRSFQLSSSSHPEASSGSRFGRQEYWDSIYKKNEASFSWYSGWNDLAPFLTELISPEDVVLIPGVGNDAMLVDMYNDGYQQLTAFDYAPEAIHRCRDMLGQERIRSRNDDADPTTQSHKGVELFVGDARSLPNLEDESFDVVLEKGTLDAIIQSGGGISKEQKALGLQNMQQSIAEFGRIIRPGGKFISISAICTQALEESPTWQEHERWEMIRDGSLHITDDGYASNNFDGVLLAWTKKK